MAVVLAVVVGQLELIMVGEEVVVAAVMEAGAEVVEEAVVEVEAVVVQVMVVEGW